MVVASRWLSARFGAAVVDDVDGDIVVDGDLDHQPRDTGVANGVRDGFSDDRFDVVGQIDTNDARRA
jgi:hypothetical protein